MMVKWYCRNLFFVMVIYIVIYGCEEDGDMVCFFKKFFVDDFVIQVNDINVFLKCLLKNIIVQIMKLCDKKKCCIVIVNKIYFGNYCKGVYKVFKVIYVCGEYFFQL